MNSWFKLFRKQHNLTENYYAVGRLALNGYDPVAYFQMKRAVKGKKKIIYQWNGIEWRFAHPSHRELFIQKPLDYTPQFGGFCSWGMKEGYRTKTDPKNAWTIVDNKLYLNYNRKYKKLWLRNAIKFINQASENWKVLSHSPKN